ncbi:DUF4192 domain-containing protein [Nocardioides sp. zg-DK7169]|uniref:DUF4192 domain-containing protein n=1 Tax=Nocardioides sp. zg-DK7169 TaxID=2736600 RepID=UPI0015541AB4|nr:DUF4192 domain-containing protein [Nocardioides sp. zg-DK7169]NPC95307.1 DUF4192 domain-containing protein [Nocardioides sp. zg-DK7169]
MNPPPTPPPTPPGPLRITARRPDDLLAVVPVVLGFHPAESVVLLTFGARRQFHARIDLPRTPAEIAATVEALLAPSVREEARAVAFVLYAGARTAGTARWTSRALVRGFELAGIRVVDAIRADGERWFSLLPARGGAPPRGVPYDLTAHPISAQAVFEGRAVLASRTAVADTLRPDEAAAARVAEAARRVRAADHDEVAAAVAARLRGGGWSEEVLASVLLGIRRPAVRDAAWSSMRRSESVEHVRTWTDAVRRAPAPLCAGAAAVLAYAAWLAGDGALAWCAVDRCREHDPGNSLARLVSDLLERAVPPAALGEVP